MQKPTLTKHRLLTLTKRIESDKGMTREDIDAFLAFKIKKPKYDVWSIVGKISFAISLLVGAFIVMFPDVVQEIIDVLPDFLYLNERLAAGMDYLWGIIGSPTEQTHLFYHLPNIILYSFGIVGLRSLINKLSRRSWKERVTDAQKKLSEEIKLGTVELKSNQGYSVLFVGDGDFVGESLERNPDVDTIILANQKQSYTNIWNNFDFEDGYDALKHVLENIAAQNAGEYIFFPVTDEDLFLPGPDDYDIAPHRLDILIRSLRAVEKENGWEQKRVIVVGDRFQKSIFQTEDIVEPIAETREEVTFEQLSTKHENVCLIDPTDLVLQEILATAQGKNVLFRSSDNGIKRYKQEFFRRLDLLGYKPNPNNRDLTIGYDIFEHQTQQQSLEYRNRNYLPVVMSQDVYDGLLRNGYDKQNILFIPDIVHAALKAEALKN